MCQIKKKCKVGSSNQVRQPSLMVYKSKEKARKIKKNTLMSLFAQFMQNPMRRHQKAIPEKTWDAPKILFSYMQPYCIISGLDCIVRLLRWTSELFTQIRWWWSEASYLGDMKDVGTEIYRLRFTVCPPLLAVSIVYVVKTTTAPFWSFVRVGVCVCVYCVQAFLGLGGETLHSCGGDIWNFLPALLAGPLTFFSFNLRRRAGERGFLKILSAALSSQEALNARVYGRATN